MGYNTLNFIGQFVTILSVNKTMDFDCYSRDGRTAPIFLLQKRGKNMNNTRKIAYAGLLAALYMALT